MSELVLNISKLSLGNHHHSLEAQPSNVGLDERFTRSVRVEAELEKSSGQVYVSVQFTTGGTFTCDRCLDEFSKEVTGSYSVMYVTVSRSVEGMEREGEAHVISPDTNMVDIGDDVRQYVILAMPQKLLCREDCAGLCPICGVNKNRATCSCRVEEIDPRWAVLKQIPKN
ncbi:MAG TPA: DUF177 domain-containing protein [Bacteroidota bacterium]